MGGINYDAIKKMQAGNPTLTPPRQTAPVSTIDPYNNPTIREDYKKAGLKFWDDPTKARENYEEYVKTPYYLDKKKAFDDARRADEENRQRPRGGNGIFDGAKDIFNDIVSGGKDFIEKPIGKDITGLPSDIIEGGKDFLQKPLGDDITNKPLGSDITDPLGKDIKDEIPQPVKDVFNDIKEDPLGSILFPTIIPPTKAVNDILYPSAPAPEPGADLGGGAGGGGGGGGGGTLPDSGPPPTPQAPNPTASAEMIARRRLQALRMGLLSTITTSPWGVTSQPNLLVPRAFAGAPTKTTLG